MSSRSFTRSAGFLLVACGMIAGAVPAHAFRMIYNPNVGRFPALAGAAVPCDHPDGFTHWNQRNIPWYLNTSGQGAGKSTALSAAASAWTSAGGNHITFYAGTTAGGFVTDGRNTVIFQAGNGCTGSCLALTALVLQAGQVIVEADISFNPSYTWQTNGSNYDTQAVMTHELGHALGIHHTNVVSSPQPTMSASYLGSAGRSLEADDVAAARCSP